MPKLRVTLSIGFANAKQEEIININQEEWDSCQTEEEREDLINAYWEDWSSNYIDGGAWIEEA